MCGGLALKRACFTGTRVARRFRCMLALAPTWTRTQSRVGVLGWYTSVWNDVQYRQETDNEQVLGEKHEKDFGNKVVENLTTKTSTMCAPTKSIVVICSLLCFPHVNWDRLGLSSSANELLCKKKCIAKISNCKSTPAYLGVWNYYKFTTPKIEKLFFSKRHWTLCQRFTS